MLLAGDVGGTQTRFAVFEGEPKGDPLHLRIYHSAAFSNLREALERFAAETHIPLRELRALGLGIAGPIADRRGALTNLPWTVDADAWEKDLQIPVRLINDFEAIARGAAHSPKAGTIALQHQSDDSRLQAFVGPGTGLGVCFRFRSEVFPGEGGHAEFAPRNPFEDTVARSLRSVQGRATVEDVLSGPGLLRLARHCQSHPELGIAINAELQAALDTSGPAALSEHLHLPAARKLLRHFVSIFGAEAGNIALRAIPRGGLFLAGGIAPKLRRSLGPEDFDAVFLKAFTAKAPMTELLRELPVILLDDPLVGLRGAVAP